MEGRAPAQPDTEHHDGREMWITRLQWRAGHLPSQIGPAFEALPDERVPSMEGRVPAQPDAPMRIAWRTTAQRLQWRAGHLPSLTPQRWGRQPS